MHSSLTPLRRGFLHLKRENTDSFLTQMRNCRAEITGKLVSRYDKADMLLKAMNNPPLGGAVVACHGFLISARVAR